MSNEIYTNELLDMVEGLSSISDKLLCDPSMMNGITDKTKEILALACVSQLDAIIAEAGVLRGRFIEESEVNNE